MVTEVEELGSAVEREPSRFRAAPGLDFFLKNGTAGDEVASGIALEDMTVEGRGDFGRDVDKTKHK